MSSHKPITGTWVGAITTGGSERRIALQLHERPGGDVLAYVLGGSSYTAVTELAVALEGASLAAGAFAGESTCALRACAGVVTSFGEAAGTLQVGLASAGACPGTGSATLQLEPESKVYAGDHTFTDCHGTRGVSIFAARYPTASSFHVAQMAAALGRLADDLEKPAFLGSTHPTFASSYLHNADPRRW